MSDLGLTHQLQPGHSQLPVTWYHDQAQFDYEQRLLFNHAPGYVGHELMVPKQGDYHTIGWMNDALALVHNQNGVELISNVCRHRQAIMLGGRGNLAPSGGNIVCPVHTGPTTAPASCSARPTSAPTPASTCIGSKRIAGTASCSTARAMLPPIWPR